MLRRLRRFDPWLYTLWAAVVTLTSARSFYGFMLKQTGGEWSAPLDDVFIHFDYARATALGHPFEWVPGNGYSSGNTSILYPFALAMGWAAGYTGAALMKWAAIVAATCMFGTLLATRALFFQNGATSERDDLARVTSYLLPPLVFGIGALNWSLWSGMEVAFFLGLWALALVAFLSTRDNPRHAVWLGVSGLALVLTRPEALTTIGVFGLFAASRVRGFKPRLTVLGTTLTPAALGLTAQAMANKALTGEWSANGAIVKLAVNNPFLTAGEKWSDWTSNLAYCIERNVGYHFSDIPAYGAIVPGLALFGLAARRTRRVALLLWLQIVGWLLLVALNGQVRWQNERYTMPAVAWLLMAAALGAGALLRARERPIGVVSAAAGALTATTAGLSAGLGALLGLGLRFAPAPLRLAAVVGAVALAATHQAPKMRDQRWFFGRASRNIRDQHTRAGQFLATLAPERVLVGDAGALMYASGARGLDIIGLGGFGKLPFARAGVHGLAASIELLERMPLKDRPDYMAIYPSWWGVLPMWFSGGEVARFPVEGNVICGGYEKVIYRADWSVLGSGEHPRVLPEGETVRDTLDVADLVNEKDHAYVLPAPSGWTDMKILADPAAPRSDLFDGGRVVGKGHVERFELRGLAPMRRAHLIVRSAPAAGATVRVSVDGMAVGHFSMVATDGWVERGVEIPAGRIRSSIHVELAPETSDDFVDYHVWITQ